MMEISARIELLSRILDPEDYRYIRTCGDRVEARLRRERMKIYRGELRGLVAGTGRLYQARLSAMNAAGHWRAYPGLVWSTLVTFSAVGKLWIAGMLFRFRLPLLVDVAAQRERLQQFFTVETFSAAPDRQPS